MVRYVNNEKEIVCYQNEQYSSWLNNPQLVLPNIAIYVTSTFFYNFVSIEKCTLYNFPHFIIGKVGSLSRQLVALLILHLFCFLFAVTMAPTQILPFFLVAFLFPNGQFILTCNILFRSKCHSFVVNDVALSSINIPKWGFN